MTLYEFNMMDEMEQQEALWDKGVLVAEREDEIYRYKLYQIDAFYIERKYHKEYDVIHGQRTFSSTGEPLAPYLDLIKLGEIK